MITFCLNEKILVFKAFSLGTEIRHDLLRRDWLVRLQSKIDILNQNNNNQEKIVFYLLILAESLRGSSEDEKNMMDIRLEAKRISDALESELYNNYMKVVDKTQTVKKIYGSKQEKIIMDEGILDEYVSRTHQEESFSSDYFNKAKLALGIHQIASGIAKPFPKFTDEEQTFLDKKLIEFFE